MRKLLPWYAGLFLFISSNGKCSWELQTGYHKRQLLISDKVTNTDGSLFLSGTNLKIEKFFTGQNKFISIFGSLDFLSASNAAERKLNKNRIVNSALGVSYSADFDLLRPIVLYRSRRNMHLYSKSPDSLDFFNYISNELGIGGEKIIHLKNDHSLHMNALFYYGDGKTNSEDLIYSSQGASFYTGYHLGKHQLGINLEIYKRNAKIFPQQERILFFVYKLLL